MQVSLTHTLKASLSSMYDSGTNYPEFWRRFFLRGVSVAQELDPQSLRCLWTSTSLPYCTSLSTPHLHSSPCTPTIHCTQSTNTACLAIYTLLYDSPYPQSTTARDLLCSLNDCCSLAPWELSSPHNTSPWFWHSWRVYTEAVYSGYRPDLKVWSF